MKKNRKRNLSRALAYSAYFPRVQKILTKEERLKRLIRIHRERKLIGRMGLVLENKAFDSKSSALVMWNIDKKNICSVARLLSSFPHVSHCYSRIVNPLWPFSLYTIIHGESKKECLLAIGRMAQRCGGRPDHKIFWIEKNSKTTRPSLRDLLG